MRPTWQDEALCTTVDDATKRSFFYDLGGGGRARLAAHTAPARAVCARCPVIAECLDAGVSRAVDDLCVWGGADHIERRAMAEARRVRRRAS